MPILRALRHRNYRLFFVGQGISLVGTWMTRIATSWLVYRLTHSPLLLGLVSFAGQFPTFLLAPIAGVYADRWNLRRVLIVTQILAMIQSFLFAFPTLLGTITIPQIFALSVFQGLINAFDMPARQSFMIHMVDDHSDLSNAIALNSSVVNGARLIGPSIAGILIASAGEGFCFLVDGISYMAVIFSLLAMRVKHRENKIEGHVLRGLKEGVKYACGFPPIRSMLILLGLISFMGMPYMALMPIFATQFKGGGAHLLGFLVGVSGFGALLGALFLAGRRSVLGLAKWIPLSSALFGLSLVAFSMSRVLWLSFILIFFAGFGMMIEMAASNTILQTIADDDKRGRVMSFYTMSFVGMAPLGSLCAGYFAERIGAAPTLQIGGWFCFAAALVFSTQLPQIRRMIRPIYIRKGILKQTIDGIQSAASTQTAG